ncbi:MAG TPA: hypothetical protein VMT20_24930 [Terriglobia bacterium]|nr:hypothetical protein [Terriglobia bacterium]
MKKLTISILGFAVLACVVPRSAFADISLQESNININGTQYYDTFSVPGLNTGGFNQTTGLGSLTLTFNPGPGTYYVTSYFDLELGVPYFNEYGSVTGSPAAGQSWQIDDPIYGTIFANAQGNTLDNTNHIPGTVDNFLGGCSSVYAPSCANSNDDVSWAMGFAFTLGANEEEVITLLLSQNAPSNGFYLGQVHPVDPNNAAAVNAYFSSNAVTQPIGTQTPEPGTWMLLITGLCLLVLPMLRSKLRSRLSRFGGAALALFALFLGTPQASKAVTKHVVPSVLTVPEIPATPATPHTTYPNATLLLGATAPNVSGSTDTFNVTWNFGDGTPNTSFSFVGTATSAPYAYDISTPHAYNVATGTTVTATVTVTDANTGESGSNTYLVLMEPNTLAARVDVAIDNGLWYMHQTMWRNSTVVSGSTVQWGGWDTQNYNCNTVNGAAYDCVYYGSINATNVQAFEVAGHFANGSATDPYTEDVARGLARLVYFLQNETNVSQTYLYNPAAVNYGCSIGYPDTNGNCPSGSTQIFYEPASTSCLSGSCPYTFDGNGNNQMIYSNDGSGETIYTTGMFVDAIVASATPNATARTGPLVGQTYQNIAQDMVDWYSACQYENDLDPGNPVYHGYTRGGGYSASGGGWLYSCQEGDDNSTSQWAAIGLIGAQRGFGITLPQAVRDFNNVWVTNAQDVQNAVPTGPDPYSVGDNYGSYGYRGSLYYSNAWGPFAVTPSGMVQMALDGIGRTANTVFGDPTNDPDQRFNNAETFYADNFCNATTGGSVNAPRAYSYGLFSFTKSMLLHDPSGALTPIQYLRTLTPNVFTTNPSVPPNTIDWYAALSSANGGTDPCDGVAQTLVSLQLNPTYGSADGHWYGNDYYGTQFYYETGWSIIMLRKTVFVSCVSNLYGRGTAGGPGHPARIDLTWSAQAGATSYDILRGTASGGPYTLIGTTTAAAFSDRSGLTGGDTYYYVVQPLTGTTEICQSNQTTVTIPKPR